MELQFGKQTLGCLQNVLSQVQNLEQTQDLRLPEGMPGVGQILGSWGQVLIRSKHWGRDNVHVSGGVQVWVLYVPEEGTGCRKLETWVPFQMDWDLPDNCPEGKLTVKPLLRFADARPVSAGKVMIRVGLALLAQCWVPREEILYQPESVPEDVQLLRENWPLDLPKEVGERTMELEEILALPGSQPKPEKLLYYRMEPEVQDTKVLANKVVFRGNGKLHLTYFCEEGQLHSWEFELPFSQYAPLEASHSPHARGSVTMAVTELEVDTDGEGQLLLKAAMTAQYLVTDQELVETVSDAWSPFRKVQPRRQMMELGPQLDSCREHIRGEQTTTQSGEVVDMVLLPDFPRQRREADTVILEQTVQAQILLRDEDGQLLSVNQRLEGQQSMKAGEEPRITAVPLGAELQAAAAGEGMALHWEVPVQVQISGGQGIGQVCALELGEMETPDPGRPSLILRRAGTDRLWDMAKSSGSTVEAIMEANDLAGQPEPGAFLLIPVL